MSIKKCSILLLIPIFLIPIWIFRYPPLGDYPMHLFKAYVYKNYTQFANYFYVYKLPCYYSLSYLILRILPFDIFLSGKIIISIYAILLPISVMYLLKSYNKNINLAIFSFPFIYNNFFHKGGIGFVLSIPITLFFIGYIKTHKLTVKNYIITSLIILVIYAMHPFAILISVLFTLIENKKIIIAFIPTAFLFIINIITLTKSLLVPQLSVFSIGWLGLFYRIREFFTFFFSFSYIFEAICLIPIIILFLVLLNKIDAIKLSIIFGTIFFILPDYFMKGVHVSQRVLIFAILSSIVFIKNINKKQYIMVMVFSLLHLSVTSYNWYKINAMYKKYEQVLEYIPANCKIEIIGNGYIGQINVFAQFYYYYHIKKGGIPDDEFLLKGIPPVFLLHSPDAQKYIINLDSLFNQK